MEIYKNPNKFISKLPININLIKPIKKCRFISALNYDHFIKIRLVDSVYSNLSTDVLIQTFLYLFNVIGQGIFVNIKKNKIKSFHTFQNESLVKNVDLFLIYEIKKFIEKSIFEFEEEVIFFININHKPVLMKKGFNPIVYYEKDIKTSLKQHNYPFYFPIVSFSSGYKNFDISLPLFDFKIKFDIKPKLMFLFEKDRLEFGITKVIYNKIREIKEHPFYKEKKIDYILCNSYFKNKQEIGEINIIIKDPNNPIFLEQLVLNNQKVIVIDPCDFFSWYDEFIMFPVWSYDNWINELDRFEAKKVFLNNYLSLKDYKKEYFLSFLNNLTENFNESKIYISPYSNLINQVKQMDYGKYFSIIANNFKKLLCWSYRMNPYYLLIDYLKTNHNFVPSFVKLSTSLDTFDNLIWIADSPKYDLEFLRKILSKNQIKYIYNYSISNLNSINILGSKTCYYIEFPLPSNNVAEWENNHLDNLDLVNLFLEKIKPGSIVIIRLLTFKLPRTKDWISFFQQKFESIKIIKNEWFDIFMPYRYLVGINYGANPNKVILDLDLYEKDFFTIETNNLELLFKYIHSEAKVEKYLANNKQEIKEWLDKYIIKN
jgi:hypothetical protein